MYEQGSFEPVARVVQLANHIEQKRLADIAYETRRFVRIGESEETINERIADKSQPLINIYHYHCNHLGTPQELTSSDGDVIWLFAVGLGVGRLTLFTSNNLLIIGR